MSEFKGLLMGMLIVAILYVLDRYLQNGLERFLELLFCY